MTKHVTIVEDDPDVRAILSRSLGADGYRVTALESGVGIEGVMTSSPVDLVILDIGLPDIDGLTITQQIRRQSNVAIIIISGRGDLADRVVGLEIGADDYITKPFEPREILARVRSVLRRSGHQAGNAPESEAHVCYDFCDLVLDVTAQSLHDGEGRQINLTSGEFKLLHALAVHAGQVVSREALLRRVHGDEAEAFDRAIDVAVSRLRAKLVRHGGGALIRTVRGEGYLFAARI